MPILGVAMTLQRPLSFEEYEGVSLSKVTKRELGYWAPLFLCGAVKFGLKLGPQGRAFNRKLSFPASILITVGFKVDGQPA